MALVLEVMCLLIWAGSMLQESGLNIHEHGHRPLMENGERPREEGIGRHQDLIAGTDGGSPQRHVQSIGAGTDGTTVGGAHAPGPIPLQCGNLGRVASSRVAPLSGPGIAHRVPVDCSAANGPVRSPPAWQDCRPDGQFLFHGVPRPRWGLHPGDYNRSPVRHPLEMEGAQPAPGARPVHGHGLAARLPLTASAFAGRPGFCDSPSRGVVIGLGARASRPHPEPVHASAAASGLGCRPGTSFTP